MHFDFWIGNITSIITLPLEQFLLLGLKLNMLLSEDIDIGVKIIYPTTCILTPLAYA